MENIWDLYIDKKLSGNMLIKRAYSDMHDLTLVWVIDQKGLTIQQWVDECCEELKSEGCILEETPLEIVKLKFIRYQLEYRIPKEYTELTKTKNSFLEMYDNMQKWGATEEMLVQMKKSIDTVESGIESLLR